MLSANESAEREQTTSKILVIGDAHSALMIPDGDLDDNLDLVANPLEGIHAAGGCDYRGVAVVTQGVLFRLRSVVDALRQVYQGKIIYLCQMVEEPLIRHFLRTNGAGPSLGGQDDYRICPASIAGLLSLFETESQGGEAGRLSAEAVAAYDRRIRHLEQLATEDDLTGLKNRRYAWEFGKQILAYAKGQTARVTILVYDIDDFKHYNDVYGHPAGDKILKEAAVLMRRCCRAHDLVGRIGGDEFVVFFWDDPRLNRPRTETERRSAQMEHPNEAILVARRFQQALENSELSFLGPGGKGVLTISGGLATYPRDGQTIEQLFEKADEALLEAKRSGKNRIYLVGTPPDDTEETETLNTESPG